jgi:hypothetical protein
MALASPARADRVARVIAAMLNMNNFFIMRLFSVLCARLLGRVVSGDGLESSIPDFRTANFKARRISCIPNLVKG